MSVKFCVLLVMLGFICYATMGGSKTPAPTEESFPSEEEVVAKDEESSEYDSETEPAEETTPQLTECYAKAEKYTQCQKPQTTSQKKPCVCEKTEEVESEFVECPVKEIPKKCACKTTTRKTAECPAVEPSPCLEDPIEEKVVKTEETVETPEPKLKESAKPQKQRKSNKAKSQKPGKVESQKAKSQKLKQKGQKNKAAAKKVNKK